MKLIAAFVVALGLSVVAGAQSTDAPIRFTVSGALETSPGVPRTGQVTLNVSLYDTETSTTALVTEPHVVTLTAGGEYSVSFGSQQTSTGLDPAAFTANTAKWIGIVVNSEAEVLARRQILTVPYAARAAVAETAGNAATLDGVAPAGFVTTAQLDASVHDALENPAVQAGLNGQFANVSSATPTTVDTLPRYIDTDGALGNTNIFSVGGKVGIGTSTPMSTLTIAPGVPLSGTSIYHNFLNVTGSLNATNTALANGVMAAITSAGSSSNTQRALAVFLNGGYTGSFYTVGAMFANGAAGTGSAGLGGSFANYGTQTQASGLTTGTNVGSRVYANNSSSLNLGALTYAWHGNNSPARNVGLASYALNATTANVAGYFGLRNTAPTLDASAAIVADNGALAAPILVGLDDGSEVIRIADGGSIGVGTAAPAYKIDVQGGQVNASGGLCIAGQCKTTWAEAGPWATASSNIGFSTGHVGIGTSTPASTLTIAPAAPLSGTSYAHNFLNVTGSLNSVNTAMANGFVVEVTSAGSSNFAQRAMTSTLFAGYTGGRVTSGGLFSTFAAGTGTAGLTGSYGNYGVQSQAAGETTGSNIGGSHVATDSSSLNLGLLTRAWWDDNSPALNVGLASYALNATTANVAGFFGLRDTAPTLDASAAIISDNGAVAAPIFVGRDNGTEVMRIADGGSIGLGTAAPAYKIDVQGGQVNASGGLCIAGQCKTTWAEAGPWATASSNIGFSTGNVGIGTTTPTSTLSIAPAAALSGTSATDNVLSVIGSLNAVNTAQAHGILANITSAGDSNETQQAMTVNLLAGYTGVNSSTGAALSNLSAGAGTDVWTGNTGNFGARIRAVGLTTGFNVGSHHVASGSAGLNIGTLTAATLDSNTPALNVGLASLALNATTANVAGYFGLRTSAPTLDASAAIIVDNGAVAAPIFVGRDNGTEVMRIADGGNVGIGTSTPMAKLQVVGNVIVNGNIGAKYQDVAEWVDSPEALEAGTIVTIDPDAVNGVVASAREYDGRVAGAVSAQPGLILGEAGEGRLMVAQSGRVRIKVDASFGAIRAGDLLVTSPTRGHAMVSRPIDIGGFQIHRPGTVIGKALEAIADGQGEILALLTLQ